jgi:hypothetical protein
MLNDHHAHALCRCAAARALSPLMRVEAADISR